MQDEAAGSDIPGERPDGVHPAAGRHGGRARTPRTGAPGGETAATPHGTLSGARCTLMIISYCEIIFICWAFHFVSFVGRAIHEFKIPTK